MMKKVFLLIVFISGISLVSKAQQLFPEQCMGTWEGMMHIYSMGELKDSVKVRLSVTEHSDPNTWGWKKDYLSEKRPVTKDYLLRLKDAAKGIYITDEQNGIELKHYQFGNKLYDAFQTGGYLLTSTYELVNDELIFELTSGTETDTTGGVKNYSVTSMQKVVFRRTSVASPSFSSGQ